MSSKDYLNHCALAFVFACLTTAPVWAQGESIQTQPFMTISAPVQLSGRPIGIEAKYSIGSPDLINEPATKIVRIPSGTKLPVALVSPIDPKAAIMGSAVQARLAENVALDTGAILPKGTLVVGHVNSAMGGLQIMFDQMQLSNGTILPISSNVVGGLTEAQAVRVKHTHSLARILPRLGEEKTPMLDAQEHGGCVGLFLKTNAGMIPAGQVLELKLRSPAQVAVNGSVL